MIHDPHAGAARALDHAATVGNTSEALMDEAAQARAARAEARRLRAALTTIHTQLSIPPAVGPLGVLQTAAPENVLYTQRGAGTPPEPDWARIREFTARVLGGQDADSALEDLHFERRTAGYIAPARRVQQDLYNQANDPAPAQGWRPPVEGETLTPAQAPAQGARPTPRPAIPSPTHLAEERDVEQTTVIPTIPAHPASEVISELRAETDAPAPASAPNPAAAKKAAPPRPGKSANGRDPGKLPAAMTNDGDTVTMHLDLEASPEKQEAPARPLALAGARPEGKPGAASNAGDGDE